MIGLSVLKDASEVVHYRDVNFPLYADIGHLSAFSNMEMMCHWHEDIEYIKPLKGHMTYYIDGKKLLIPQGEAVLINSKRLHYGYSEDGTDCDYLCILFRPRLLAGSDSIKKKYINSVTENEGIWGTKLEPGCGGELMSLFDEVFTLFRGGEPCYEMRAVGLLCEIWAGWYKLSRVESGKNTFGGDIQIQKDMVEYIYEHYGSKITLRDIARAGGVCESKCCRIFRKNLKKTPVEFLNAYRLEISMNLLGATDFNITEIAYSCGFGGSSYYAETFMKYKGCTPREYRALQRE